MKKFMAIYMAPVAEMQKMMQDSTKEEQEKGMREWQKWMDDNKEHFVDVGAPLGKNKRIAADGVEDVRNEIAGYSIIKAETHDDAAKIFATNQPHLQIPGAYIEIMELVAMP